jgi:endonuclease III
MATTTNKQRTLTHLLTLSGPGSEARTKGNNGDGEHASLPVLEQVIFALCRENATKEQARQAFESLKERFFDWNEVRVSTIRELEEALAGLSDAESRAQRLVSFLQEVFEEKFAFELEDLHKKGLKQAAKKLMSYGAANDYVGSWVVQRSLGGHAIPIDQATQRCARRLGLIDGANEDPEAARATLEHLVPKAKGPQFTDAVSQVAETHCWEVDPDCPGCPLRADCPTGQEARGEQLAGVRAARAKPR